MFTLKNLARKGLSPKGSPRFNAVVEIVLSYVIQKLTFLGKTVPMYKGDSDNLLKELMSSPVHAVWASGQTSLLTAKENTLTVYRWHLITDPLWGEPTGHLTDNKQSSIWPLCCHWWHRRRLSLGQLNTLRPRWNGRHFADDIFKCTSLNENFRILHKISLKYVP